MKYLVNIFKDAKEYGSILKIEEVNFNKLTNALSNFKLTNDLNRFKYQNEIKLCESIINQSITLSQKYDITITNPPYMGNKGMDSKLNNYLKINFKNTKKDLSTVFMERSFDFTKEIGFISMINIPVWMFISSYETLREEIINRKLFINMLHLGRGIFGSDFGTTAFVIRNKYISNYNSTFKQLYKDSGAVDSISKKEKMFFNDKNKFITKQNYFSKIPGGLIAYWVNEIFIRSFNNINLGELGKPLMGTKTADNNKYMKMFWEIDFNKFNEKWMPCAKGGDYKKYYGNVEMVIDWSPEAKEFYKNNKSSSLTPDKFCFKEGITYNSVSSKGSGFRYLPDNSLSSNGGPLIINLTDINYCLGFLNSCVAQYYLSVLNPTINLMLYNINSLPIIINETHKSSVEELTIENISLTKNNWDSYETSYEFKKHPFLYKKFNNIEKAFDFWVDLSNKEFEKLKNNEILLNKLFIMIYEFNFLESNVDDDEITIKKSHYETDIKSFISYAVGCMFGRYSLDQGGIIFAGGNFNLNNYNEFIPDDDNIIPVLDTAYFEDDIVGRFVEFVKTCFGEEHLEENLDFIANALTNNKKSSREKIRDYMLKNFFNGHKKIYKNCPIYWQFSSGKENGFNCLVYMHRYEPSLVARIRTDYLHKTQKAIEQAIANCDNIINHSSSNTEITKATKDKNKLQKQLKETIEYDEALAHIANQNIEINLDDGVKVNYAKFQNVEVTKEGKKSKKINLLKKL